MNPARDFSTYGKQITLAEQASRQRGIDKRVAYQTIRGLPEDEINRIFEKYYGEDQKINFMWAEIKHSLDG